MILGKNSHLRGTFTLRPSTQPPSRRKFSFIRKRTKNVDIGDKRNLEEYTNTNLRRQAPPALYNGLHWFWWNTSKNKTWVGRTYYERPEFNVKRALLSCSGQIRSSRNLFRTMKESTQSFQNITFVTGFLADF